MKAPDACKALLPQTSGCLVETQNYLVFQLSVMLIHKKWLLCLWLGFGAMDWHGHQLAAQTLVGFTGGYGVSTVLFDPTDNLEFDLVQGGRGGIMLKNHGKNVGIQAELNYVQKGWRQNFRNPGSNLPTRTADFTFSYLELPIMTQIYLGQRVKYFLNLGPHFAYQLGVDSTFNLFVQDTISYRYRRAANVRFEYGASVGFGLSVDIGKGSLHLEARGSWGLNNVIDRDRRGSPVSSQNLVVHAKLGYLHRIGEYTPPVSRRKAKKAQQAAEESP